MVPLSRSVDCDEYQAIGRRVAATLGIDKFDDTSYQPQRMMYWPSCSQDAPFVFRHTDGAFLDPDTVLATYHDWRDVAHEQPRGGDRPKERRQAEGPAGEGRHRGRVLPGVQHAGGHRRVCAHLPGL